MSKSWHLKFIFHQPIRTFLHSGISLRWRIHFACRSNRAEQLAACARSPLISEQRKPNARVLSAFLVIWMWHSHHATMQKASARRPPVIIASRCDIKSLTRAYYFNRRAAGSDADPRLRPLGLRILVLQTFMNIIANSSSGFDYNRHGNSQHANKFIYIKPR